MRGPMRSLNAVDPNLQLPRTYQWNFAVEQALGSHQAVSASMLERWASSVETGIRPKPNPNIGFLQ